MRPEEIEACLSVLRAIAEDRTLLAGIEREKRRELIIAAGRVARPERNELRAMAKAMRRSERREKKTEDAKKLSETGVRTLRSAPIFLTPPPAIEGPDRSAIAELNEPRSCYVCKKAYTEVHFFYASMCKECGDFNWQKRNQSADLTGRTAIVTGARIKIGYHAAIKLLRAGARVIVTTRFPKDAAARYAREQDFDSWASRLSIFGLDLRHTPSVEILAEHLLETEERLDFIVNNACQTIQRPPAFYRHLIEAEAGEPPERARRLLASEESLRSRRFLAPTAIVARGDDRDASLFPKGQLDADLQQIDLREMNSWRLRLGEVSTVELLEVLLVNSVGPFVLNGRLKPLMLRHKTFDKHVVNVSAMEGQFYRTFKTDKHPHTNMAKAALNMMTRTSAADYARDGIHMNSVDTGWITDEDPLRFSEKKAAEQGDTFDPPLDVVDGASRILDPIFDGILTGRHRYGQFFKDYQPAAW
jgi:NAD(P)-dependent dehydrogenase (short-subunit alcohol dehydrogenase family)